MAPTTPLQFELDIVADDPDLGPLGEDVDGGLHELPEEDDGDDAVGYEHPVSDRDVLLPPSPAGGGDGRAAARYVADGAEQVQDGRGHER